MTALRVSFAAFQNWEEKKSSEQTSMRPVPPPPPFQGGNQEKRSQNIDSSRIDVAPLKHSSRVHRRHSWHSGPPPGPHRPQRLSQPFLSTRTVVIVPQPPPPNPPRMITARSRADGKKEEGSGIDGRTRK